MPITFVGRFCLFLRRRRFILRLPVRLLRARQRAMRHVILRDDDDETKSHVGPSGRWREEV